MKILVIEDEKDLSESICTYLSNERFFCEQALTYDAAIEKAELNDYACIILDIGLPGGSGMDILHELKRENRTDGVLIVSAKSSIEEKVEGLKAGADDYLSKPFHLSELAARVEAIIRRKYFDGKNTLQLGSMHVDLDMKEVAVSSVLIELTKKEYDLLLYFISNKNKVVTKNAIASHLWGEDMYITDNFDFIYTHIKNLRKKLLSAGGGDCIQSVYGMGYKFLSE